MTPDIPVSFNFFIFMNRPTYQNVSRNPDTTNQQVEFTVSNLVSESVITNPRSDTTEQQILDPRQPSSDSADPTDRDPSIRSGTSSFSEISNLIQFSPRIPSQPVFSDLADDSEHPVRTLNYADIMLDMTPQTSQTSTNQQTTATLETPPTPRSRSQSLRVNYAVIDLNKTNALAQLQRQRSAKVPGSRFWRDTHECQVVLES